MHPFAIDTNERTWTIVALGVLAVLVSAGFAVAFTSAHIDVPWFVGTPTPLAVFGVLFAAFERWGWHGRLGNMRLSRVPDLRGRWVGNIKANPDGHELDVPVRCYVRQTWQRICVEIETATSCSTSQMASFDISTRARPTLVYTYLNEPLVGTDPSMQAHRGTAQLQLSTDGRRLHGDYYSGRGRAAMGTIELGFESRDVSDHAQATNVVKLVEDAGGA